MTLSAPLLAGALALVAGLVAVTRADAVHAALWLVTALLAVAAAFFALGAPLAGAVQIIVYAGAVMVVVLFVVMTLDLSQAALARERQRLRRSLLVPGAAVAALVALLFAGALEPMGGKPASPSGAKAVGALLFGPWAVAVELASFLLLAGLIAVRHVGRRDRRAPPLAQRPDDGEAP